MASLEDILLANGHTPGAMTLGDPLTLARPPKEVSKCPSRTRREWRCALVRVSYQNTKNSLEIMTRHGRDRFRQALEATISSSILRG